MTSERGRPADTWDDGVAYERYMGRWSRLVAAPFIGHLGVPAGRSWLDVGSGSGALSQTILKLADPAALKGVDPSGDYVALSRGRIPDSRASFATGDAQQLPVESSAYDAVVSGLMLNFVPQPQRALAEMARAARPGGVVAVYVWDYAGKMQLMRHFWNAAVALDPAAAQLDEGRRFPLCQPEALASAFRAAGLQEVEGWPIDVWTEFRDFEDYWSPFLGGQGPAPGYVAHLSVERRDALRERIRAGLPFALDGSIPLVARALAVRGYRPA